MRDVARGSPARPRGSRASIRRGVISGPSAGIRPATDGRSFHPPPRLRTNKHSTKARRELPPPSFNSIHSGPPPWERRTGAILINCPSLRAAGRSARRGSAATALGPRVETRGGRGDDANRIDPTRRSDQTDGRTRRITHPSHAVSSCLSSRHPQRKNTWDMLVSPLRGNRFDRLRERVREKEGRVRTPARPRSPRRARTRAWRPSTNGTRRVRYARRRF